MPVAWYEAQGAFNRGPGMIHRIRDNVAKHNWFAVAVDLGIVVLGVFLGIQASNWNQDLADRAEARELRTEIIRNLKANEADLDARAAYFGQVRAHAVTALESLASPKGLGEQFLVDAYQASQSWLRPLERTAYEELVSTGLARKIGGAQTRTMLSSYYVGTQGFDRTALAVTPYRDRLRRVMDLRIQEKIRASCDDVMQSLPGGGQAPALPSSCQPNLDPIAVSRVARKIGALDELDQDLTRLIIDIDQKQALFERTRQNAVRLRRRLEAA